MVAFMPPEEMIMNRWEDWGHFVDLDACEDDKNKNMYSRLPKIRSSPPALQTICEREDEDGDGSGEVHLDEANCGGINYKKEWLIRVVILCAGGALALSLC
jgi:hypothetical protein